MSQVLSVNPDAVPNAPPPRTGIYDVNGTTIYAETRGSGPVVVLVGAADEDAEFFRPVAERIPDRTVITFDRRGTLRSGREGWPADSAVHADDVVGLLRRLEEEKATVFGASAGGIVALQAALRYPDVVDRALVFEPGLFLHVENGERLVHGVYADVQAHLNEHEADWAGAVGALGRAIMRDLVGLSGDFFASSAAYDWYTARAGANAEALIRGDLPLTLELMDLSALARASTSIKFSFGAESLAIFSRIAEVLSAVRGEMPERLEGMGHAVYRNPQAIAAYIAGIG